MSHGSEPKRQTAIGFRGVLSLEMQYNRPVFTSRLLLSVVLLLSTGMAQQNTPPKPAPGTQQPPVRVTVLNVCVLSDADAKTMTAALDRISLRPAFAPDFEIARGITTVEAGRSRWVRARHEFTAGSPFSTVQYTISEDAVPAGGSDALTDTLVLRLRDPKDIVQISLESQVVTGKPAEVLEAPPTAGRIRLERAGATSIVLARCADKDQSAREPIFAQAARILSTYRKDFHAGDLMAAELSRPDMKVSGK